MIIRYPAINGKTEAERQRQIERYLRYLAEVLNQLLKEIS